MRAYDHSFNPPAPVAELTIAHPVTAAISGVLHGILDSGADITVIPDSLATRLQLTPHGQIWTQSYNGTYSRRLVYYVRLTVEGFELPAVRCVAADRSNVLLGRNVLNHFIITLDGKRLGFELIDP